MAHGATSSEQRFQARTTELPLVAPRLADGGGEPVFFWDDPAGPLSAAGFGVAAQAPFHALAAVRVEVDHPGLPGPWFGGIAFDRLRHRPLGTWSGFETSRFILPQALVWRRGGRAWLTCFAREGARMNADVRQLAEPSWRAAGTRLELEGGRARWGEVLRAFLEAIRAQEVSKVVAAREIHVELETEPPVHGVLRRLRESAPTATVFMVRSSSGDAAFLGATPERLCRIVGRQLETDALASSAAPPQASAAAPPPASSAAPPPLISPASAPAATPSLLGTDKNLREHQAVVAGLRAALTPLCERVDTAGAPRLLALPYVTHLWTPVQATLREGVAVADALDAIHPTAAVGGAPRERALELIARHEGWPRGWYAGAIGWASTSALDLKVALRSALLRKRQARVFVGAGIVEGSEVEREWEETELKARPMLAALGVSGREVADARS